MAAIDAVFRLVRPGDHVIVSEAVYGGVFRLSTQLLAQFGIDFTVVDTANLHVLRGSLSPRTKLIYVETPTNPTMPITETPAVRKATNEPGRPLPAADTFLHP